MISAAERRKKGHFGGVGIVLGVHAGENAVFVAVHDEVVVEGIRLLGYINAYSGGVVELDAAPWNRLK